LGPRRARPVDRALPEGGVVSFGLYGGALATAIRRFKYDDRPDLARPLGSLLVLAALHPLAQGDVVVPVPLHPRRLTERGYNQAALIAAWLARARKMPLVT